MIGNQPLFLGDQLHHLALLVQVVVANEPGQLSLQMCRAPDLTLPWNFSLTNSGYAASPHSRRVAMG